MNNTASWVVTRCNPRDVHGCFVGKASSVFRFEIYIKERKKEQEAISKIITRIHSSDPSFLLVAYFV
jgi:hypothetical protein